MTEISRYVSYREAVTSQTAIRKGIMNDPPFPVLEAMQHVARAVFDPLREHFGYPLRVSSFFRCEKLNRAIGGAATSQHVKGEAMDIQGSGTITNRMIFDHIRQQLPFDQLIGEGALPDGDFAWVHVSLKKENNRKEVLLAKFIKGKAQYVRVT